MNEERLSEKEQKELLEELGKDGMLEMISCEDDEGYFVRLGYRLSTQIPLMLKTKGEIPKRDDIAGEIMLYYPVDIGYTLFVKDKPRATLLADGRYFLYDNNLTINYEQLQEYLKYEGAKSE